MRGKGRRRVHGADIDLFVWMEGWGSAGWLGVGWGRRMGEEWTVRSCEFAWLAHVGETWSFCFAIESRDESDLDRRQGLLEYDE